MKQKNSFLVLSFVILLLYSSSCKDEYDSEYNYFLIPVDSIAAPDSVKTNDSFEIAFWGLVGVNGCYQFFEFSADKQENMIVIEAWGKIKKGAQVCPDEMVYLRGKEMDFSISEPGQYLIKVRQSEDLNLEHSIFVTE